jgi:predicted RNase H-like HicB family nuclease
MNQRANVLSYDVVFEEQPEGGFTVTVPALSGCISEGDSFEEAKKNIKEAMELYLESLIDSKEEIPVESSVFVGKVEVVKPVLSV